MLVEVPAVGEDAAADGVADEFLEGENAVNLHFLLQSGCDKQLKERQTNITKETDNILIYT